jgi:predicted ATPase
MIMDEPEISLHTDWQEDLITNIRKLNENVQIIIATHSPFIIAHGWVNKVFQVNKITTPN